MKHRPRIVAILAVLLAASPAVADDWPQWGGPQHDLTWRETGIVSKLPPADPATGMLPRLWTAKIGAGYAGPAVAAGRVYVTDRVEDKKLERVLCFDAATGVPIWQHEWDSTYSIGYPLGPRATPTVDGDRVYVLGAVGDLLCLDTAKGNVIWQKQFVKDFKAELPTWGSAAAPLVDGDQLIVLAGGHPEALVVSLDKRTGAEKWRALEGKDTGYCAPAIFEIAGRRQLVIWHPQAVTALDPADGKLLWQVPFEVQAGMTIPTPRLSDNRLLVTGFYCGPLMIDTGANGISPNVLWRTAASNNEVKNDSLHAVMCTPIFRDGFVYGIGSYGELRCLDGKTGKIVWESRAATGEGRWWNAFLIPHGDQVIICNEQGDIIFSKLSPEGYEELSRAKLIAPTQPVQRRMTVWSHPAFAMRSVFARNDGELIRVDLAVK